MTEALINKIKPYVENERFNKATLDSVNKVAANMAEWVTAMNKFYYVNLIVKPKQEQLAIAEKEFNEVNAALNVKKAALKKVQDKVDDLRRQLKAAQDEK